MVVFGGAFCVGGQAGGAFGKGAVAQDADLAGDAVQVQLAAVQLAGDRQGHQQDGVAEGVLGCAGAGGCDLVGERLGEALDGGVLLVHGASWCGAQEFGQQTGADATGVSKVMLEDESSWIGITAPQNAVCWKTPW